MSRNIFISHSSKDKELADELVDLLQTGLNISSKDIFCSSLEGLGIPSGKNFISYIKEKLQSPEIVLILLTENYFSSEFCLCELGATWAMSHNFLPIIVPPLSYDDVKGILVGMQLTNITDPTSLTEFRMQIEELLNLTDVNSARWESKRNSFLKEIAQIIKKLPSPQVISLKKFEKLNEKYQQSLTTTKGMDNEIRKLSNQITDLKRCKGQEEVKKVEKKYLSQNEHFEKLLADLRTHLQKMPDVVSLIMFKEFSGQDDVFFDPFEEPDTLKEAKDAVESEFLTSSDRYFYLNRNDPKVLRALTALECLNKFIEKEATFEFHDFFEEEKDYQLSLTNRRFWDDRIF
jgi:hypothetical protein